MIVLHTFLQLLGEALPLFLIGAILGAALEVWLPVRWIENWLSGGHRSVGTAIAAGALLPGCAMSTMPLARSMGARGARLGTLTAFIMIAPILSPQTLALTATLVSAPMAVARVVLSVTVSFLLGWLLNRLEASGAPRFQVRRTADVKNCCGHGCDDDHDSDAPVKSRARRFWETLLENLRALWPFLVVGLLVASVLTAFISPEAMQKYMHGGWLAYLAAAGLGIPIYVCDGGEIPLTRAFLAMGVGPGPAFCFMLASVGTCLPTITMATRIIGWAATTIYLFAWLVLSVGGGMLMAVWLGH